MIVGCGAGCSLNGNDGRDEATLQESQSALQEAQTASAAATELRDERELARVSTRELWGRPSTFNGKDARWRDWSVVFRRNAGFVNARLMPQAYHLGQNDYSERPFYFGSKKNITTVIF